MRTPSTTASAPANVGTDELPDAFTAKRRAVLAVANHARLLWGFKVAQELAARMGVSPRSAEDWMAGRRGSSWEPLAQLLECPEGPSFLEALIATMAPAAQARWRKEFEKAAMRAELRRQEAEIEARRREHGL